jgi:GLPGLI family protein
MKISTKILLGLLLLINAGISSAQKTFEGVITFSLNIESDDLDPMAKAMFSNMEQIMYIKGSKSRTETDMGMSKTTTISDDKTQTVVSLSEVMGQKFLIRIKPEDLKKQEEKSKEAVVKLLPETKKIQGYNCKKAEITMPESPEPVIVYYTTEIPLPKYGSPIQGIEGMPLEYDANMGGFKLTYIAKSIKAEKVPDSKFLIPEGYKETTLEELQKMFMGGN